MNILEKGILLFIFKNSSNCLRDFAYDTVGPVFGVCGRERLIPVCLATGIGLNIEIFHLACWHKMGLSVRKPFFGGGGGGGGGGANTNGADPRRLISAFFVRFVITMIS